MDCFGHPRQLVIRCGRYRRADCTKSFVQPLPGIRPGWRSSEPWHRVMFERRHDGICAASLARCEGLGQATVGRIYAESTEGQAQPGAVVLGKRNMFPCLITRLGAASGGVPFWRHSGPFQPYASSKVHGGGHRHRRDSRDRSRGSRESRPSGVGRPPRRNCARSGCLAATAADGRATAARNGKAGRPLRSSEFGPPICSGGRRCPPVGLCAVRSRGFFRAIRSLCRIDQAAAVGRGERGGAGQESGEASPVRSLHGGTRPDPCPGGSICGVVDRTG